MDHYLLLCCFPNGSHQETWRFQRFKTMEKGFGNSATRSDLLNNHLEKVVSQEIRAMSASSPFLLSGPQPTNMLKETGVRCLWAAVLDSGVSPDACPLAILQLPFTYSPSVPKYMPRLFFCLKSLFLDFVSWCPDPTFHPTPPSLFLWLNPFSLASRRLL